MWTTLLPFLVCFSLFSHVAVTYELRSGRFGDQILGYLHAKWISYQYGIPLLYRPFPYSEEFALHDREEKWAKECDFAEEIRWVNDLSITDKDHVLYVVPFFSDLEEDRIFHPDWSSLSIDWEDSGFRKMLRPFLAPRNPFLKIPPRIPGHLMAALHIRQGGGVEISPFKFLYPKRSPPESYYIDCLKRLCDLFPYLSIQAHIFTDDPNPQQIAHRLQEELGTFPITFTYRAPYRLAPEISTNNLKK